MKEKWTTCKVCGVELAANAKTCPKCGAKQKKKHPLIWGAAVLLVLVVFGAATAKPDEPEKVGEVPSSNSLEGGATGETVDQEVFQVGDQVALNNVVVSFDGVTESSGQEFLSPEEGKVYLICEFTIENQSDQDITVSSMLCFEAYVDDYATAMNLSAMAGAGKTQLDGTVAAGKKMNGIIGYEVPTDWQELEVHFTPDFWAQKDIVFTASH